jgi:hypothetical protein
MHRLILLLTAVVMMLIVTKPALAAPFAVDRNDDPDPTKVSACTAVADDCSLRGAILTANAAAGADTITVPAGTYTLTRDGANEDAAATGDLDVTEDLTIIGTGARATSVAGGAAPFDDRIFEFRPGLSEEPAVTATITGLTITGGKAGGGGGGGVKNRGDLTLERVAVKGNTSNPDGIGGGIFVDGGSLELIDSTVSGNSATSVGGLLQQGGTANITNSTISSNHSAPEQFGGGVAGLQGALVHILNSTIASNTSGRLGGGILTSLGTTVLVKNTIVSGNTLDNCDTAQLGGAISSQGHNVSSDDTCNFTKPTDELNTNSRLGALANNGGPTDTRALLAGSPAVDAGNNAACPLRDQRGIARKDGDKNGTVTCDIGSFERNDLTAPQVTTTTPVAGKMGVKRNANLTATFSERMDGSTLNKATFKLFRVAPNGSTSQITNVTVSSSPDGLKATLNPFGTSLTALAANTKYKAVVTTAAKDLADNRLDQNRNQNGNQQKEWTFTSGAT